MFTYFQDTTPVPQNVNDMTISDIEDYMSAENHDHQTPDIILPIVVTDDEDSTSISFSKNSELEHLRSRNAELVQMLEHISRRYLIFK